MPLNIELKKLPDSEIEISGEIPAQDFSKFWKDAVGKISQSAKIPGFRPGNVPENILIEKVGESEILEKAAELALQKTRPEILEEEKIEAIGHPEIVITKLARQNPLGFKIKTAVIPQIILPDYRALAKPILEKTEEIKVEEKELADALEYLKKSREKDTAGAAAGGGLPELNDEFAKSLGKFENLEALKNALRENIRFEKELKLRDQKRTAVIDAIARETKVEL